MPCNNFGTLKRTLIKRDKSSFLITNGTLVLTLIKRDKSCVSRKEKNIFSVLQHYTNTILETNTD